MAIRMMRGILVLPLLTLIGCAEPYQPVERGTYKVAVSDRSYFDTHRERPLDVSLWYPTATTAQESPQNYHRTFTGIAARDAKILSGDWPLVMLSHGDKGNRANQSWLAENLASHGYIVAAVDHWHNTTWSNRPEETVRVWHRPGDITVVLNELIEEFSIDQARIYAVGHSAGGYTALALAGAVYLPQKMQVYCEGGNPGPACKLVDGVDWSSIDFSRARDSYRDERIRKVVAMAPALGPGISENSLRRLKLPVLLVSTAADEVLRVEANALRYRELIPGTQWFEVPEGGHFIYLSECNGISYQLSRFFDYDICGSQSGADRRAMHSLMARTIRAFFEAE